MNPTYEQLEQKLQDTQQKLQIAEAKIEQLTILLKKALDRIAELEEKLNKNSKNSSKPPSTDQKANTSDVNHHNERPPRVGKNRVPFPPERIDKHIQCTQENCPYCGSNVIQLSNQPAEILQQAELPEVKALITEYELLKYRCKSCGKNSVASLPNGVPDSAFGPKLMGFLATLTGVMHLAKKEAVQLIKDLFGVDMGIGSVPNIEERVTRALDPIYDRIHRFVMESKWCKHFDETGWRDRGKRHFVWLATCQQAAVYMIDRTRSAKAFKRLIGRESCDYPAVTDRYNVYLSLKIHQYCLAHLIREFRGYGERTGNTDEEIGQALEKELSLACAIHKEYRDGKISLGQRNRRLGHRKRRVQLWLENGMANGSDELYKLSENLLDDFENLWTFSKVLGMEPTNNMAERDLRKLVIWRKKSYGTRSDRGKRFVERITTIAQTMRKQEGNVLSFIQNAVEKFYQKDTPPFLAEALGF